MNLGNTCLEQASEVELFTEWLNQYATNEVTEDRVSKFSEVERWALSIPYLSDLLAQLATQ